jgi:hypothetical protein
LDLSIAHQAFDEKMIERQVKEDPKETVFQIQKSVKQLQKEERQWFLWTLS